MKIAAGIAEGLLLFWFFGCVCTYRIGRFLLVEGEGVRSPEFVMFCCYSTGILLFWFVPVIGQWWLLTVLTAWLTLQFLSHWRYTLFGATEQKLSGYNECFQNTVHWIPARADRLIPDLYHMILHLLIFANWILVVLSIVRRSTTSC